MSSLRLANIVHRGVEVLAIEHEGRLLGVSEIEQCFEINSSPAQFADALSFRRRVIMLGIAGLDEVFEQVRGGPVPSEAILNPAECLYLPPTTQDPALLEFSVRSGSKVPTFQRGWGRCLLGHESPLAVPHDEPSAQVAVEIAAILGDDVRDATLIQAERAILGYAVISLWTFPARDQLSPGWGRHRLGQLGPTLVMADSGFDPSACEVVIAVNGTRVATGRREPWNASFARMISFASEGMDLLAGDVIASGPLAVFCGGKVPWWHPGDRISAEVSGLGILSGMMVEARHTNLGVAHPEAD